MSLRRTPYAALDVSDALLSSLASLRIGRPGSTYSPGATPGDVGRVPETLPIEMKRTRHLEDQAMVLPTQVSNG